MIAINGTPETHFKETEVGLIPVDWEFVSFQTCISNRNFNVGKIKARDYLEFGNYPIIDQSQDFIAGYWDDNSSVYDGNVPIIIFGDHTRIFKFIDFRFVCGADGTKIIQPNTDLFDPLFLFFVLQNLEIPNKGYNRHYTVLKEKYIQCPPLPEQRRIATVLNTIQDEIAVQDDILHELREFKRSTMERLFTYGAGDTPAETKMTEVGEIPAHWEVKVIGDVCDLRSGSTPNRSKKEYWDEGSIPWVKTGEINYHVITFSEEHITDIALKQTSLTLFPSNTLILAMYGQGITRGKVAILGIEATINQACLAIMPKFNIPLTLYLFHYLNYSYLRLREHSHGTQQANLSGRIVASIGIAIPPQNEQKEIIGILDDIDRKIFVEEDRKSALQDFFRSTLQQLMTGQIRLLSDEGMENI